MSNSKRRYPKNVIVSEIPYKDEEDESLRELYEELDLKKLFLVSIDARKESYKKFLPKYPPFGGSIAPLEGLNKRISFLELKARISMKLRWPIDEIRIWEKCQYEEYVKGNYDVYSTSIYRDYVPEFISLEENEVMFPLFLSEQYIVAERTKPSLPKFPPMPLPQSLTQNEWWLSLFEDWNGRTPTVNKSIYTFVEVVRMERNRRNNTLFNALGYLFHIISDAKGEEELDESKDGLTQACRFRAAKMRANLARFVADNWESVESSQILGGDSIQTYFKKLLDPSFSGGDTEITLVAIMSGALIQVFDIRTKKMLQYGKGHVERFGNPERLGPRFAVKMVRWANDTYDPLAFCLQAGMNPDRHESAFAMAYVIEAFRWMEKYPDTAMGASLSCAFCEKRDGGGSLFYCSDCRLVAYCNRGCQIAHWKSGHRGVCQKRDYAEESAKCLRDEEEALCFLMPELLRRRDGKEGVRLLRKVGDGGFVDWPFQTDEQSDDRGNEVGNEVFEEVNVDDLEGLYLDENVEIRQGKIDTCVNDL